MPLTRFVTGGRAACARRRGGAHADGGSTRRAREPLWSRSPPPADDPTRAHSRSGYELFLSVHSLAITRAQRLCQFAIVTRMSGHFIQV